MTSRLEDLIGKTFIIVVYAYLTLKQIGSILHVARFPDRYDVWQLVLVSRIAALIFLLLAMALTLIRLPPKNSAAGIEPRITSIAGTFCLMLLVVLPTGSPGVELRILSTVLIVAGTIVSIVCAVFLGRSFSIMATARRLVTHGPYSIVRHPLYVAEAITVVGVVISNWSAAALAIGALQFALQYRRMLNEERALRAAFPEYDDYAKRVPMIVPFSRPAFMTAGRLPSER